MKIVALLFILCAPWLVYAENSPEKLPLCMACHGPEGISANPEWPNLAGQHAKYTAKQLNDMKKDSLIDAPTMKALVATLTDKEIEELAQYYAKLPAAKGTTPTQFKTRGEQLYKVGDFSKQIAACSACHGPQGTGNAQGGFPHLGGQHANYLMKELQAFKEGKRANDLNHIMQGLTKKMSQEDMEAVSHYIEGLN